jgi:hypothetical protein
VAAARADPGAFTGQKVGMVADHHAEVIRQLQLPHRGHSLIVDHGWTEVARTVHDFFDRSGITPS